MSKYITKLCSAIFLLLLLTACGGGNNPDSSGSTPVNATILHWSAPVLYENDTTAAPSDISGFKIYQGDSASDMNVIANIADSSITQFDLKTLSQGTFYFAVTAYDSNNIESKLSKVVYLTI